LAAGSAISFGAFQLFPAERMLRRGDHVVRLGGRAFDILATLADRPGELVSSRELMDKVWPDVFVGEASLRFHIAQLRKALDGGAHGGRYVLNVPGRGYVLVEPAAGLAAEGGTDPDPVASTAYVLPPASEQIIGRDEAVRELSEKLRSERFVTIVGPGGVGKTTVALSVANGLLQDFAGAVCFVELSSVSDAGLLASVVTSALGARVQAEDPLPELIAHLRGRTILLVLDNCEHVICKAAEMAERLFVELEQLSILVTSREGLQVEGEHIFRLPSLASPPEGEPLSAAHALAYPAAQLFANRMAFAGATGALSDDEAAIIGGMCRQLSGLPLAIELAAGRAALLGARDTAAQLDSLFALHWPGRRTAPPRQQTLGATLDWSYGLLSGAEQAVLRRLSIFSSRFTLDAAQDVAVADDIAEGVLFDAIGSLFAKSLLSNDRSRPTTRYRLLDTTRTYARQKLEEAGERELTRRRHALYYRDHLKAASADERSAEDLTASLVDLEDIRTALQWSFGEGGDELIGADIAAYSAPLWLSRALFRECVAWITKALAAGDGTVEITAAQRLRLHVAFASAELFNNGFTPETIAAWTEALEHAEALGDLPAQLQSHLWLWGGAIRAGRNAEALHWASRCAAAVEGSSDAGSVAMGEWMVGHSKHHVARFAEARYHLEHYLAIETEDGRSATIRSAGYDRKVDALALLSNTLWCLGRTDQAKTTASRAVEEAQSLGFAIPIAVAKAWALLNAYQSEPDMDVVERDAVDLLEFARTHSMPPEIGFTHSILGLCQARRGQLDKGMRLVTEGLRVSSMAQIGEFDLMILAHLCEAAIDAGRLDDARRWMAQLESAERNLEDWCSVEPLRVRGLLALAEGDEPLASKQLSSAVQLARGQQASSWELRATMSLGKFLTAQGRGEEAARGLEVVLGPFKGERVSSDILKGRRLMTEWMASI
jgi:predicted ATPase/DNA-binding winged helix-turn-helix (wHTH) protein